MPLDVSRLRSPTIGFQRLDQEEAALDKAAPTGSKPASAQLTPLQPRPRTPTEAARMIDDAAQSEGSRHVSCEHAWSKAKAGVAAAETVGVAAARKTFWSKVLGAAVAALAVTAIVSATVATGGAAAVVAGAVIVGIVCAVSVADAGCAYMNFKNAQAHARQPGCAPPYDLPMGSSSLGNLFCRYFEWRGADRETAKGRALIADVTMRVCLGLAAAGCTLGVALEPESFAHLGPLVGGAVSFVKVCADLVHDRRTARIYDESLVLIEQSEQTMDEVLSTYKQSDSVNPHVVEKLEAEQSQIKERAAQMRDYVPRVARTGANLAVTTSAVVGSIGAAVLGVHAPSPSGA